MLPRHILLTLHQIRDAQTILEGPCGCRFPTNQAQTHTVWPVSCQKTYISWFSELCLVCFFHIPLASHQLTITFFLGGCWTKNNGVSSCSYWLNFKAPLTIDHWKIMVFWSLDPLFDTESKAATPTSRLHNKSIKHTSANTRGLWHEQFNSNGGVVTYFHHWQQANVYQGNNSLFHTIYILFNSIYEISKHTDIKVNQLAHRTEHGHIFKRLLVWFLTLFYKFQWCGRRSALASGPSA